MQEHHTVTVNGQSITTSAQTLTGLIAELSLSGASLVAEVNGTIIPSDAYAETILAENDAIELVRFVGGG